MEPKLKKLFTVSVTVDPPIVVGQDDKVGRRQLIPITGGTVEGEGYHGVVLPGGVDSQIIRPNGRCDLSARYGVRLDDGTSFYVENNGVRSVPPEYTETVVNGGFIDPSLYYFCTKPEIEVYDPRLNWMVEKVLLCSARRLPDQVLIDYYLLEQE